MLNKDSYEVLKNFPERLCIRDKQPIHHELLKAGYLRVNPDESLERYYCITQAGKNAIEEYERKLREEKRGDDALDVARKANDIACESNAISRKANQISNTANCKSTVAIVVAVIAILAQIASAFHEELWGLVQRLFHG